MNTPPVALTVREVSQSDDLVALTALIRAAYAPLAERGLKYWATHQSPEDTAQRFSRGQGFVGLIGGEIVATIALSRPDPDSKVELLRNSQTWSFGQFAVAPTYKKRGYGRQIHDFALGRAAAFGCEVMALHTAQPASHLIEMYRLWGYREAGTCDWRPHTNFLSVLMTCQVSAVRAKNAG